MKRNRLFSLVSAWVGLAMFTGASLAADPVPVLVKDIREGELPKGLDIWSKVVAGGKLFMSASAENISGDLWISDGTAAGTGPIKTLYGGMDPQIRGMTAVGNRVFFVADDPTDWGRLWVSDGTEAGTFKVPGIGSTGEGSSDYVVPGTLRALGTSVIFVALIDGEVTLWKSDGTAGGSVRLKTLDVDVNSLEVVSWTAAGSNLYFSLPKVDFTVELWKTNGTSTGTTLVKNLGSVFSLSDPQMLAAVGSTLFFAWESEDHGIELWKSNGTSAGTVMVKDIAEGLDSSIPRKMVAVGTKGYFLATTVDHGEELWVTDGTAAGTTLLHEVTPGETSSEFTMLAPLGKYVIAAYQQGVFEKDETTYYSRGVMAWDTVANTPARLFDDQFYNMNFGITDLVSAGTQAFFVAADNYNKTYLYHSNGTPSGTGFFRDPQMQVIEGSLAGGNGVAFFDGDHEITGKELWKSDGTDAGTVMVENTVATGRSSDIQRLVTRAGRVYFSADDGIHGRELWTSDGTPDGTHLVKDIAPEGSSLPQSLVEMNGVVYFFAEDGTAGSNLWRTDGTEAGTVKIVDAASGFFGGSGAIGVLPQVGGGRLFFSGYHMAQGRELWMSDGVSSFTVLTETLSPGTASSNPDMVTAMDGRVYYISGSARGLYSTDGGAPWREVPAYGSISSLAVRPPNPGAAVLPGESMLFFTAPKSNATALYRLLPEVEPLELMSGTALTLSGAHVHEASGRLFFTGPGLAAWRTDGTVIGTQPVGGSLMAVTDDKIYYYPTAVSSEIWSKNLDGSNPVRCLSGANPYQRGGTCRVGRTLFFSDGPVNGGPYVFWRTQGTPETTRQIPGITSLNAGHEAMTVLGDHLHLVGFQAEVGAELFSLDIGGRLEVDLLTDTAPTALAPGATVDLGMDAGDGGLTRSLRLRNAGTLPLTAVTVTPPELADYTVTPVSIGTVAAGAAAEVQIRFSALEPGVRDSSLSITAQRVSSQVTFGLVLKGRGLGTGDMPVIGTLPAARLALAGQPVLYDITVGSIETPAYLWKRGTTTVGTSPALSLTAASAADAGVYAVTVTNGAGSVTSNESALGILTPAPAQAGVVEGAALTLSCTAKAPAGATLSYLWRFNGAAITPTLVPGSSDATKPVLKISGLTEPKAGNYDCLVTMTTPAGSVSLSAGATAVSLLSKPQIPDRYDPVTAYVGGTFTYAVPTTAPATRFTAKGLPAGLKISPTGVISGRPTKASAVDPELGQPVPSKIILTAGNAAGTSDPAEMYIQVLPLLPPGSYEGLIDRDADLDEGQKLGSHVAIQITGTGAFSGQLTHGAKNYRFTSAAVLEPTVDGHFPVDYAEVAISRGKGLSPLTLVFALNADRPSLILENDSGEQAAGILRRAAFSSKQAAPTAYQGYYTHQVANVGEAEYAGQEHLFPRGLGYLMTTISKTGLVSWKGKLADGTAILGSAPLCEDAEDETLHHVAMRQDLYKGLGSVQGWGQAGLSHDAVPVGSFGTTLSWYKAPLPPSSKERNYKDGFPVHTLATWGDKYIAPNFKAGETLLNIPTDANAASLELYYASLPEGGLTQSFTLGPKTKVTLPKWDGAEIFAKSLSFNVAQGSFKGSFSLKDPNPDAPNKPFIRTVNFEGVILGYPTNAATGFFLLPDLPAGGTSLTTSPLRSGSVSVY